tara:strand:- start:267 stop:746 length:480 start_codon:yes stop_codon:yes gene_type:complete
MTNNIKTLENKFVTSMGSGVSASESLYKIVESANASKSGQSLASVLFRLKAKGDAQGYRIVSSIVGTIFKGAKLKKAKDKKTLVLDISNADFDSEAMIRFEDAVNKKLSIRGALAGHIKGDIKTKKKIDLPKTSKTFVDRMIKEGYSIDAIIASIQALR